MTSAFDGHKSDAVKSHDPATKLTVGAGVIARIVPRSPIIDNRTASIIDPLLSADEIDHCVLVAYHENIFVSSLFYFPYQSLSSIFRSLYDILRINTYLRILRSCS